MTTTVVQNVVTNPQGNPIANALIRVVLIASVTGTSAGHTPTTSVEFNADAITDATGRWSLALVPNAEILVPTNTYYQVNEAGFVSTFVVPVGGGPYNLTSLLTGPPPVPAIQYVVAPATISAAADGVAAGTRPQLNFVSGTNVTVTAADNPGAARVDVTVNSTGGTGTPSGTVVAETTYGQASTAGAASAYARGDHTHGSPSLTGTAPAVVEGIGQAAALGSATTPAKADHVHPMAAAGAPGGSAVGDTTSTGSATTPAGSDHRHAREAFGSAASSTTYGQSAADGVAATVARSDHVHGTPTLTGSTPAAETIGASGAVGTGSAPARSDHIHAFPLAAVAGSSAVGDVAAAGSAATLARSDHAHGREAFGAVTAQTTFGAGSTNGAATTIARSDHAHGTPPAPAGGGAVDPYAAMLGLKVAAVPYPTVHSKLTLSSGTLVLVLVRNVVAQSITTLGVMVTTAGVTASGVNGLALYTEAGVLVDQTADMSAALTTLGWRTGALGASQALAADTSYYLGALTHYSGTNPIIAGALTDSGGALDLSPINGHYPSVFAAAQASFPGSVTPSGLTVNSGYYFIAGT